MSLALSSLQYVHQYALIIKPESLYAQRIESWINKKNAMKVSLMIPDEAKINDAKFASRVTKFNDPHSNKILASK